MTDRTEAAARVRAFLHALAIQRGRAGRTEVTSDEVVVPASEEFPPLLVEDLDFLAAAPEPAFEVAVSTLVETNFGDHGEFVRKAHRWLPGETVEELLARVLPATAAPSTWQTPAYGDVVELRIVVDSVPEPDRSVPPW